MRAPKIAIGFPSDAWPWGDRTVHLGLSIFPTEYSIQPAVLAQAAEVRGFESLWLPEHSHIPVRRESAWPGGPEIPKVYYEVYEPFISLAAAAAVTTRLKLATGICLVVQRDPLQTAKNVATLDRISGGRFLFGIGAGWNAEEMRNHGTEFRARFGLLRERVLAMKALWSQEQAEFHGRHVDFDPVFAAALHRDAWASARALCDGLTKQGKGDAQVLVAWHGQEIGPFWKRVLSGQVATRLRDLAQDKPAIPAPTTAMFFGAVVGVVTYSVS